MYALFIVELLSRAYSEARSVAQKMLGGTLIGAAITAEIHKRWKFYECLDGCCTSKINSNRTRRSVFILSCLRVCLIRPEGRELAERKTSAY